MHDWEGAEQMEMIYNWILKLSFFAVLGSVILQMIPDHGFQKYVRFLLGLILAAMLVVPVLELFDKRAAFEEIYHDSAYKIRTSELEEKKSESSGRYSRYRGTERRESKHRKFGYGQPEYRGSDTRFEHRQEFG